MFREMTLGQYYQADSILHRLDPRVKLFGTMIYVISLFLPKSIGNLLLATTFLIIVVELSKVPWAMLLKGVRPLMFIILFSVVVNIFSTKGVILLTIGPLHITKEGLWVGFYIAVRLLYLLAGSSIMTFTTTPNQLTNGLERAFGFLKKIKIPVHDIAMMMSIALRFIPILTEELDRIMKAQMSRGADFECGNLFDKVHQFIPVLVPLFIAAIRRASDLALAMDARCYNGGENRTQLHPLQYASRDYAAYGIILLYLAVTAVWSLLIRL